MYAARFSTRDDDGEEYCNKRNGVANELLKRDMLQGKSGSEALAEFAEKSFCEFTEDIISQKIHFDNPYFLKPVRKSRLFCSSERHIRYEFNFENMRRSEHEYLIFLHLKSKLL